MAFILNREKLSHPSVVYCFTSLKHCFGGPSVRTAWDKKEIQTLFSLFTWNCITGQMATTCVRVKYIQHNAGSAGTTAEGFCEAGDFVLFSYQTVSHACSSIRSAAFVWLRPERWLLYAATQSYRICRQKCLSPTAAQGSPLLAVSNIFCSTSLEMRRSVYGNRSQAGAGGSCLFVLVDKQCIKHLWWAGEGAASWIPNSNFEFSGGGEISAKLSAWDTLCVSLMGNGKHQQLPALKCILSLSPLNFLSTFWSHLENQI